MSPPRGLGREMLRALVTSKLSCFSTLRSGNSSSNLVMGIWGGRHLFRELVPGGGGGG